MHARGEQVDFALVDGLHTYDAVQADARALLAAGACHTTTIVFHDTAHAGVRAGLEDLDLPAHPKVGLWLPDFVPGYRVKDDPALSEEIRGHAFNGLGLLVLDPDFHPTANGHEAFVPFADLR